MKKKLFLMMLLLGVAVQGAWAQSGILCTASDKGRVICTDGSIYDNVSQAEAAGRKAVALIRWIDESSKKGLALSLQDEGQGDPGRANWLCDNKNNTVPVAGATWKLPSMDEWNKIISGDHIGTRDGFSKVGGQNLKQAVYYSSTKRDQYNPAMFAYNFYNGVWKITNYLFVNSCNVRACLEFNLLTLKEIGSADEWKVFCAAVNLGSGSIIAMGSNFQNCYVKLTNDINVTEMAGWDEEHSFQGVFDGNGHTLTVNYNTTENNTAPFSHVKGAVIKNLHVAGTITTSAPFAGGIVSESHGALTLYNCRSSVNINSTKSGDGTHGGLVSTLSGKDNNIVIDNCVFDGSFATTNGTNGCGGFVGWGVYNKPTISNSLLMPSSVDANMLGSNFARWYTGDGGKYEPTITNCYYVATDNLPTDQGLQAYKSASESEICKKLTITDQTVYSAACTVSGVEAAYDLDGRTEAVNLTPTVTDPYGTKLSLGTDYTATLNGADVTAFPIRVTVPGDFSLVITGKGNYTGSKTVNYSVTGTLAGATEAYPILINSEEDWNTFVNNVNNGTNDYNGMFLLLNADISVSQKVGTVSNSSPEKAFKGTFDGNGHTITTTITDNSNQGTALFCYINGATIKNLTVDGTISSSQNHLSGLVGFADGTNTIEGCTVTATLNISSDYAGGIVGHGRSSTTTIRNSVFAGTMNAVGNNNPNIGVIWGWSDSYTPTLVNCLEAGTYTNIRKMHPMGLKITAGTITNCYYLTPQKGEPSNVSTVSGATQVYTSAPSDAIVQKLQLADGKDYYKLSTTTVSGIAETYTLDDGATNIEPTVTDNDKGTTLTLNTDFTATVNGDQVAEWPLNIQENGKYTLTLTGMGNYGGSKSFTFIVGEYKPVISTTTTLSEDSYMVYEDVTIDERITIDASGYDGASLYLSEGTTLHAKKGIELGSGHRLTIYGPGKLIIDECDNGKSGIGAATAGTLTIRGGQLDITSGSGAAGIGSDAENAASGNLTLIWTLDTDYVKCNSYSLGNPILFSKSYVIDGEQTIATSDNIAGEKIVPAVELTDNGNNDNTLGENNGMKLGVVLKDYTLYKDSKWSTICLPFYLPLSGSPLEGAEVRPLMAASISGTTLNLTFGDPVTALEAGTPYIIKWTSGDNLDSPVFPGVYINNTDKHDYDNGAEGDVKVQFFGTYDAKNFTTEDKSTWLMGNDNKLYNPTSGASFGAFHAYFKIGDGTSAAQVTDFNINFGDADSLPIVTFTDADTYTETKDVVTRSATYKKTLGADRTGKYQPWLVPFDYTITAADVEKFTFWKLNMIANSPDPNVEAGTEVWVYLSRMKVGDVLHANTPYVYKPLTDMDSYDFTTRNAVLKAKNTDVILKTETADAIYSFYATYEPTTATAQDPFYYVNYKGRLSVGNNGTVTVGAFRWIMRVESKVDSTPVTFRSISFVDEEGTTGINGLTPTLSPIGEGSEYWYTLDGRRLQGKPSRAGVYIYNGKKFVIK